MDILLIAPASGNWQHLGKTHRLFSGKTFRFSLLSLLRVAAETPAEHQVRIVDEQLDDIPWDDPVDLVGITCMTAAAPRAYEIADTFRRRGVPVVLGGMHPSFLPQEALQHASAVVAGDAEGVWPRVLAAAAAGTLGGVYRAPAPPDLHGLKPVPRHLLQAGRYATVNAVQATRGCPHRCSFCSVSAFHQGLHRRRPVAEVVHEVAALPGRFFMFTDDNLTAERDFALELFRALAPLHKQWLSQTTLRIADDPELLTAAAEAGCVGVFVGMETFAETNLASVSKDCHRVEGYRRAVRTLHAHGIGVEAGIVLGFDGDDPAVFRRTLEALKQLQVDMIQVSILTPLPGTPLHADMQARITESDWSRFDFHHVVFRPQRMDATALQAGHDWVTSQFYRPWNILRRLARLLVHPRTWRVVPYALALNLAYYGRVRVWRIRGWDPGPKPAAATTSAGWPLALKPARHG